MSSLIRISLLLLFFSACTFAFAGVKKSDSTFVEYYDNGKIKTEGQFRAGERHGKWKYYDENGVILKITKYKKGYMIWERLFKNGRLTQITDRKGRVHRMKDCGC